MPRMAKKHDAPSRIGENTTRLKEKDSAAARQQQTG
jgi:hypothetical protein